MIRKPTIHALYIVLCFAVSVSAGQAGAESTGNAVTGCVCQCNLKDQVLYKSQKFCEGENSNWGLDPHANFDALIQVCKDVINTSTPCSDDGFWVLDKIVEGRRVCKEVIKAPKPPATYSDCKRGVVKISVETEDLLTSTQFTNEDLDNALKAVIEPTR